MTHIRTRGRRAVLLATAAALATSPTHAVQAPDATVVLLGADFFTPSTSEPSFPTGLSTGADRGWAVAGSLDLGMPFSQSVLFGDLTPGGIGGAQLLRTPTTLGGYTQSNLFEPSTAGGRLAYIESSLATLGSGGQSLWIDDQLIAQSGDPIGSTGLAWTRFRDVTHLANGDTYARGQWQMAQGLGTGVVRFPDQTPVIQTGDLPAGLPSPVTVVREFQISPSGAHWIALVRIGTQTTEAIVVDGTVHDVGGGNLAIVGGSAPDAIAGPNATFSSFARVAINDSGNVAFTTFISTPAASGPFNVRDGRRVESTQSSLGVGSIEAIDPRGFIATLEGAAFIGVDGLAATGPGTTVDIDGDGAVDAGWSLRFTNFGSDVALSSDGTDLFWVVELRGPSLERRLAVVRLNRYGVAQPICTGRANSTGSAAHITAIGLDDVSANDLALQCIELPTASAGLFLASPAAGFTPNPGGSAGDLCLAGSIGRYNQSPFVSDVTGRVELPLDLTAIPQPSGPVAATAGSTWYFQSWYRDAVMGSPTSNFSDAIAVQLR